jgi:pimeloyl-ACP methyl ester carboxylesterase
MAVEHHAGRDAERRAGAGADAPLFSFLWPLIWTASAGAAAASLFESTALHWLALGDGTPAEPEWTTPNTVALELPSMRLRDFGKGERGRPTIVCAPYALHGATIVDFAPGHSLVEALRRGGLTRPLVTDWRSATPEMRFFSIDTYLADLNVAVDELTPPVDLVGLCQGGWLALVYAARFPGKVRRLVLAGAPVDVDAAESPMSRAVRGIPLSTFESLVRLGDGRVLGRYVREAWAPRSMPPRPAMSSRSRPVSSRTDCASSRRDFATGTPGPSICRAVLPAGGGPPLSAEPDRAREVRRAGPPDRSCRRACTLVPAGARGTTRSFRPSSCLPRRASSAARTARSRRRSSHVVISACSSAPEPSAGPGRALRIGSARIG